MPKDGLQDPDRTTGVNGNRSHGMAQAVQGDMRQSGGSQGGGMSAGQSFRGEIDNPAAQGAHALGAVKGGQLREHGRGQGQVPEGSGAFERAGQIGAINAQALAAHVQNAGIGVNIGPLEAEGLTAPEAAGGHEQQQGPSPATPGGHEIGGELRGGEHSGLGRKMAGLFAGIQRRGGQVVQAHGLCKRGVEHGKNELRGARMHARLGIDDLLQKEAVELVQFGIEDAGREGGNGPAVTGHGGWGAYGQDKGIKPAREIGASMHCIASRNGLLPMISGRSGAWQVQDIGESRRRKHKRPNPRARARATNVSPFPQRVINGLSDHDNHDNHDHDAGARVYARTCARAGARVETAGGLPEELFALYEDVFCRHMPGIVAMEIMAMMAAGAGADLVAEIIRYTAGAPRPSWAYARAVLRRQMAMGTRTAEDFAAREAARAERIHANGMPKRVIEQCYEQRRYDAAEFGELSEEQLAEMAKRGRE